jgi:hypothetical protein
MTRFMSRSKSSLEVQRPTAMATFVSKIRAKFTA